MEEQPQPNRPRLLTLASDVDEVRNHLVIIRDAYWMGNRQDISVLLMKASLNQVVERLLDFAIGDAQVHVFTLERALDLPSHASPAIRVAYERMSAAGGMVLKNVYNFSPSLFSQQEHMERFFKLARMTSAEQRERDLGALILRAQRELDSLRVQEKVGAPSNPETSLPPEPPNHSSEPASSELSSTPSTTTT